MIYFLNQALLSNLPCSLNYHPSCCSRKKTPSDQPQVRIQQYCGTTVNSNYYGIFTLQLSYNNYQNIYTGFLTRNASIM